MTDCLKIRRYKIIETVRLGTKKGNQPRPLLVKLNDEYTKWNILKNAKNLKNEENGMLKDIIISRDLTKEQRVMELEFRKLCWKLHQKRNNSGPNICPQLFQNSRIWN